MSLFLVFEQLQNETIFRSLTAIWILIILILLFKKICYKQKTSYEKSYIKQTTKEFEQNKKELTKYHIEQLIDNPKFQEWQSQQKKN